MPAVSSHAKPRRERGFGISDGGLMRITESTEVSVLQESTPERVKAAARAIKRGMPPAGSVSVVEAREAMWI